MTHKFIRPSTIDVGRGPEVARLRVRRGAGIWELPAAGARVPWSGSEGMFWRRRVSEGSAEIIEKPEVTAQPVTFSEE